MITLINDLIATDRDKYGSKATSLGVISKSGIRIPNGFAVPADTYLEFLEFNQFPYKTEEYLAKNENIVDFHFTWKFSR